MIYVLDTTLVSALMRSEAAAAKRLLQERREDVLVPQPVVAEICYGLQALPRSRRRQTLEHALAMLLADLPRATWNDEVSQRFGEIKADLVRRGEPIDDFDVAIAAHAVALAATVVTRNLRHFKRVRGLAVEDWA